MKIFLNENILISQGTWIPDNITLILENLSGLIKCLNCFNFHIEPIVFYSGTGLKKLFENFTDLEFLTDYSLTNPLNQLRVILNEIDAVNWEMSKIHRADHNYYFMSEGGAKSYYVNNTSIAEATEYLFVGEDAVLLNLISSEFNETNPVHISRSSINPPPNIVTLPLQIIKSKTEVINYVIERRKNRTFNWNPKHGEYGKGAWVIKGKIASPLECSREEAAGLLPDAVNSRKTDELYAYHVRVQKFMVFKNENTNDNKYHPYHPIDQSEVPDDVKKFLTDN